MIPQPHCFTRKCKHFKGVIQPEGNEIGERPYCEAFPGGIPDEIAYGGNKHLRPIPGQGNDIVFEKK